VTGERFEDFQHLETISQVEASPSGGWLSLWQLRHTVGTLALLPGLLAINLMITDWTLDPLAVVLVSVVSAAQAIVGASFLPQRTNDSIVTCGMIPPVTMLAASALLSELPTDMTFGFLALGLVSTGVAFRFFATTCLT
jgi:hypothetical protein